MKIIFAIDDTDNAESPGTGHLAQDISERIEQERWGKCSGITRHQLYIHRDIPYTSHNSAMCFEADILKDRLDKIIDFGIRFLEEKSAQGSDPGLCVAVAGRRLDKKRLTHFGLLAKRKVLTKELAYALAGNLKVHLTEHGGTGQGVVGALAGVGLRLAGNDGRFRGWYHFGRAGEKISVQTLCSYDFIDSVRSCNGEILERDAMVLLGGDRLKTVLRDAESVVLVTRTDSELQDIQWKTLTKEQVKQY